MMHKTSNSENPIKIAQLEGDFFTPENFKKTPENSSSQGGEISEHISDVADGGYEIAKQENIQQESEIFSVQNISVIRHKRDMQNYINAVADDMEVEKNEREKLLISYSKMMQLNEKIEQYKEQNKSTPYGFESMKKKVIEDFVKQQTESNVTYQDQNSGKNTKNKNSQNSRNSGKISRRSQKNTKKKGVSTFAKVSGGVAAGIWSLYSFA